MSKPKLHLVEIGTFEVTGGTIACCDPCYSDPHSLGCVLSAAPGTWVAWAMVGDGGDSWGERVWRLQAWRMGDIDLVAHDAYEEGRQAEVAELIAQRFAGTRFEFAGECPVDGGVLGVFDGTRYHDREPDRHEEYRRVMFPGGPEARFAPHWAITSRGAVTGSGYGDGGYNVYAVINGDRIVTAVQIVFIDDEIYARNQEDHQ